MTVYNLLGEEITTLVKAKLTLGTYRVRWDATTRASGIYLYRIEVGLFSQMRKLVWVK